MDPVLHSRPAPCTDACGVCGGWIAERGHDPRPTIDGDARTCSPLCAVLDALDHGNAAQRTAVVRLAADDLVDHSDAPEVSARFRDPRGRDTEVTGYIVSSTRHLLVIEDRQGEQGSIEWAAVTDVRHAD